MIFPLRREEQSAPRPVPPLDLRIPDELETATFAVG